MAEANHFPANGILLVSKGKRAKSGIFDLGHGSRSEIQALHTDPHLDVGEPKGGGIGRAISIFAGAKKKEESQADHVGNGNGSRIVGVRGNSKYSPQDRDRDWFHSIWRRIFLGVCF